MGFKMRTKQALKGQAKWTKTATPIWQARWPEWDRAKGVGVLEGSTDGVLEGSTDGDRLEGFQVEISFLPTD